MKIKTICRDCIFKTVDENNVQIGCLTGRLDKFKQKNKTNLENNYFSIDGLCNFSRDTPKHKEIESEIKFLREDVKTPFYLFINCTTQENIPLDIIDDLKNIDYKNITVHFIFDSGNFSLIYNELKDQIGGKFKFFVSKLYKNENVNFCVSNIISKLEKRYFIGFMDFGCRLNNDCFNGIDVRINDKLDPLVCYIDEGVVFIYNNLLQMIFKECTSALDIDFYISRILAWTQSQKQEGMIWIC